MNRMLLILAISVLSGSLLAKESPTTPKSARVRIIQGPAVRAGEGAFDDYPMDNEQSRSLPGAFRNRPLWHKSTFPNRDRQISDQIESESRIDGFPRTP